MIEENATEPGRHRWMIFVLIAVSAFMLTFVFRAVERHHNQLIDPVDRRAMSVFERTEVDGSTWRLSEHRGQIILLNYWATWCGPCRQEAPLLVRINSDLQSAGVLVVGVSLDEGPSEQVSERVRQFIRAFDVNYPVLLSPPMSQMLYAMDAVPTTVLLDRKGRIAKTYVGAIEDQRLRGDIAALLREVSE